MFSSFSSSPRMCVNNLIWCWGWRSCIGVVSDSDIISEMHSHHNKSQNLIDLLWVELSLGGIPFSKCCDVLRSLPWSSCSASWALVSESRINNFITVITIISVVSRSVSTFVGTGMHPIGRRRINGRWWLINGSTVSNTKNRTVCWRRNFDPIKKFLADLEGNQLWRSWIYNKNFRWWLHNHSRFLTRKLNFIAAAANSSCSLKHPQYASQK